MLIYLFSANRHPIGDFAEKHKLQIVVRERTPTDLGNRWLEAVRFFAHFKGCHVRVYDDYLIGEFGNGATVDEAIANYANLISGKTLVCNLSLLVDIFEITVPIFEGQNGRNINSN